MSIPTNDIPPADGSTITIPVAPPAAPPAPVFTAEDIERARQQEKDKLYGRITSFEQEQATIKAQLAQVQAEKDAEVAAAAEAARKEAEEAARKQWEESDSKTLVKQVAQEWETKFNTLQQEREQERALFAREQEFNTLKGYAQSKVQAALADGTIAPEMADFVTGNNTSEIDASLDFVRAKTAELVNNIKQAQAGARAAMPGVSTAGYAVAGPMDTDGGTRTLTAADIQGMSMADYAKARGTLLPAASQAQQGRGLYG